MPDNPFKGQGSTGAIRSGKTALQWAQIARDRNDLIGAVAWEKAHRDGWDEKHFDPAVRDQHNRTAAAWAGKKGIFTNRVTTGSTT
jgi:hypothetical protein